MFRTLLGLFVAAMSVGAAGGGVFADAAEGPEMLSVGTYSGKDSMGDYLFALDPSTGSLENRIARRRSPQ